MPEKDFEIWINETTSIRIRRITQSGRLASFSVVLVVLDEIAGLISAVLTPRMAARTRM